jgi:hypothetical protein
METNLDFLPELRKIKKFLHTQDILHGPLAFPYAHSEIASLFVSEIIKEPEFRPVFGELKIGSAVINGKYVTSLSRAWNYLPDRDIYADVSAMGEDIAIIKPDMGLYKPYPEKDMESIITQYKVQHKKELEALIRSYNSTPSQIKIPA